MTDGLHEVGFAHPDAAVQKQRVVGLGRPLSDCLAGRVGELVAVPDDESVERVARIQLGRAVPVEARLARGTQGRNRGRGGEAAIATNGSGTRTSLVKPELD